MLASAGAIKLASMRLLFVLERYPPDLGGVARSGERTARAISRLGVSVEVFAWTRALAPGQLETNTPQRPGEPTVHRMGLFSNWDFSMQHTMNLLEWLHGERKFDVAWGHYVYPAGFAAALFAETHGLKSVVSARGNDVDRLMFPPGDFARLEWALRRASAVTAVSQDLARKIGVLLGDAKRSHVIHNSVDLSLYAPSHGDPQEKTNLRKRLGVPEGDAILGFCGELRHKKGLPFLLDAIATVNAKRPAWLLIIGEVRARERVQLVQWGVDAPEIALRIIETGHITEQAAIAEHLRLCDLTLIPSVWDGLPNALLESMACGVPVLASDAGGIPEVIEHGKSGFIVPRAQLHRLGEAILEILDLPESEQRNLGREARRRVEDHYDGSREEKELAALLSSLRET